MDIIYDGYVAGLEMEVMNPGLKSDYKSDALPIALTGLAAYRIDYCMTILYDRYVAGLEMEL